jgi:hypothetical protein
MYPLQRGAQAINANTTTINMPHKMEINESFLSKKTILAAKSREARRKKS